MVNAIAWGNPCSNAGARMPPLFSRTRPNTRPPNIVMNPQARVICADIPRIHRKMPICIAPNSTAVMIAPQPKGTSKNRYGFPKTWLSWRQWGMRHHPHNLLKSRVLAASGDSSVEITIPANRNPLGLLQQPAQCAGPAIPPLKFVPLGLCLRAGLDPTRP